MARDNEYNSRGVALLVDGENLSAEHAQHLVSLARSHGELRVARVYGNVPRLQGWDAASDFHVVHTGTGNKNSADMLLTLEAADLAWAGHVQTFVLGTSDQDFTHLARYLRGRRFLVIGAGGNKTPDPYRRACSRFEVIASAKPPPTSLDDRIRQLVEEHGTDGSMRIADINGLMRKTQDFRISNHPKTKTWRSYLKSKPDLYDYDKTGTEARVRLKT